MLCLWLPFTDGTTKNYGLTNMDVVDYGTSVYDQGKLGKCRSFVGNGYLQLSNAFGIKSGKDFSCCYWIKEISNNILSQFRVAYQCGNLIIGHYGNKFNIYSATGNALDLTYVCDTTEWVHCCMTYQGSNNTVTIYINGVKCSASQPKNLTGLSDTTAFIGKRSSGTYLFEGYLNDFRIYNTCLSPRQIKEISKGLVCHYPLGEVDGKIGGRNILKGSSIWTKDNPAKSSSAADGYVYIGGLAYLEKGKTYTLQAVCDAVWASKHSGDDGTATIWIRTLKGEHKCFTGDNKTSGRYTWTFVWSYDSQNCDIRVNGYNKVVNFWNIKIESGNKATPWTPAPEDDTSFYDNVIYDTSGYCNNGSVEGNILWDNNTPRYKGAYNFNQTGYIKNDGFVVYFKEFTISYWIKIPENTSSQHFAWGTFNNWTVNGAGSWRDSEKKYSAIVRSDTENHWGDFQPIEFTPNEWSFVSYVYTGTTIKTYKNGSLIGTKTYGSNGRVYMPVVYLGNSLFNNSPSSETDECSMVDFRIYATALDNQTIEELYKVGASVDSSGNLYAYDFNEN